MHYISTQIQFAKIKSYDQVQNQWGEQQTLWTLLGSPGKWLFTMIQHYHRCMQWKAPLHPLCSSLRFPSPEATTYTEFFLCVFQFYACINKYLHFLLLLQCLYTIYTTLYFAFYLIYFGDCSVLLYKVLPFFLCYCCVHHHMYVPSVPYL